MSNFTAALFYASWLTLMFGGWLTHLMICFRDDTWGLLIIGTLLFPIGIMHGIGNWLGFW